jgi:hypothetical protein
MVSNDKCQPGSIGIVDCLSTCCSYTYVLESYCTNSATYFHQLWFFVHVFMQPLHCADRRKACTAHAKQALRDSLGSLPSSILPTSGEETPVLQCRNEAKAGISWCDNAIASRRRQQQRCHGGAKQMRICCARHFFVVGGSSNYA